jgi:hypothetical protein
LGGGGAQRGIGYVWTPRRVPRKTRPISAPDRAYFAKVNRLQGWPRCGHLTRSTISPARRWSTFGMRRCTRLLFSPLHNSVSEHPLTTPLVSCFLVVCYPANHGLIYYPRCTILFLFCPRFVSYAERRYSHRSGRGAAVSPHPLSRIFIRLHHILCRLVCLPTSGRAFSPPIRPALCKILHVDFRE